MTIPKVLCNNLEEISTLESENGINGNEVTECFDIFLYNDENVEGFTTSMSPYIIFGYLFSPGHVITCSNREIIRRVDRTKL